MSHGENTNNHPNRSGGRAAYYANLLGIGPSGVPDVGPPNTPQAAMASGLINPTSAAEMDGFEGPKCNNCGSYNTEESSAGGHDCYDCGHTSNPSRPAEGSSGPDALQNMFRMG